MEVHAGSSCTNLRGMKLRSRPIWRNKLVQENKLAQESMPDVQVSCASRFVQVS